MKTVTKSRRRSKRSANPAPSRKPKRRADKAHESKPVGKPISLSKLSVEELKTLLVDKVLVCKYPPAVNLPGAPRWLLVRLHVRSVETVSSTNKITYIVGRNIDTDEAQALFVSMIEVGRVLTISEALKMPSISPSLVTIVHTPKDWNPKSASDLPPNVDSIHVEPNACLARVFANRFNELEMKDRSNRWAVAVNGDAILHQEPGDYNDRDDALSTKAAVESIAESFRDEVDGGKHSAPKTYAVSQREHLPHKMKSLMEAIAADFDNVGFMVERDIELPESFKTDVANMLILARRLVNQLASASLVPVFGEYCDDMDLPDELSERVLS